MPIRMIALDLDRTTLNREGHLSQENRRALEEAIRAGIYVVPASGRAAGSFPAEIMELPGLEYLITSNGAAVYRMGKKSCKPDTLPSADSRSGSAEMRETGSSLSCLQRFLLQPAMVRKVMELTEQAGITYEALVEGKAYTDPAYISDPTGFGAVREAVPYIRRTRIPVEDIRGFLRSHENQLDSLDIIVGDPEKKKQLMALLNKECADIYVTSSVEQLIEISDRRAGKHSAVKFLRERLEIAPEEVAAFGDGDNDAEMLREAGVGIAVENASPACLAAADAVTRSCDENGVAYGFREILRLF